MSEKTEAMLARHADKGKWTINKEELSQLLGKQAHEAGRILAVTKEASEELGINAEQIDLKPEGLIRARNLGQRVYENLPQGRSVLVVIDSSKPRAVLTRAQATDKIHELESSSKKVDMIHITEEDLSKMLQDEGTDTWPKFGAMMENEGISEDTAIARQMNEISQSKEPVPGSETPEQAEQRYRKLIQNLKQRITSENVPVVILGIGHSGPLALIRRETLGQDMNETDVPIFCEIHNFDAEGNLIDTQKVDLKNEKQ